MEYVIVPAIIADREEELVERVKLVRGEVSRIHVDVMDGEFVESESNYFHFALPRFKGVYEAHLMVRNPLVWLQRKEARFFDVVVVHAEIGGHRELEVVIDALHKAKKEVFLAFNPETSCEGFFEVLKKVDGVQVMCVHPGQYGSAFIPRTLEKVEWLSRKFPGLLISVDGGMDEKMIALAKKAGANVFVVGSRIFMTPDPLRALWELEKVAKII